MLDETMAEVLKRINFVAGHLDGVRKMVEKDAYCVDILKQTYAVRCAIQKMETIMLERHLRTCVVGGIREGRDDEVLAELAELYRTGR
jgi:DNA-binding FrmR family transcriptional regulator